MPLGSGSATLEPLRFKCLSVRYLTQDFRRRIT